MSDGKSRGGLEFGRGTLPGLCGVRRMKISTSGEIFSIRNSRLSASRFCENVSPVFDAIRLLCLVENLYFVSGRIKRKQNY